MLASINILTAFIGASLLVGCNGGYETPTNRTAEMEAQARSSVVSYLAKQNLTSDGLSPFKSSVQPEPGFSYLYTGNNRCIEIIVLCYGQNCNEVRSYPYDRHGEKCPL